MHLSLCTFVLLIVQLRTCVLGELMTFQLRFGIVSKPLGPPRGAERFWKHPLHTYGNPVPSGPSGHEGEAPGTRPVHHQVNGYAWKLENDFSSSPKSLPGHHQGVYAPAGWAARQIRRRWTLWAGPVRNQIRSPQRCCGTSSKDSLNFSSSAVNVSRQKKVEWFICSQLKNIMF